MIVLVYNPNIPGCVNCDSFWIMKLSIGTAGCACSDLTQVTSCTIKLLDAMIISICNINIPGCINCDSIRILKLSSVRAK